MRPFDLACPAPLSARGYALRIATEADEPLLRALYVAHRWGEFAILPMDDAQKTALLDLQYTIQRGQYANGYANPRFLSLTREGSVVGRMTLGEIGGTLRLVDILLAHALRGQGVGGTLIRGLLGQAGAAGWPVTLHVDPRSPAQRLYARLGFRVTDDHGTVLAMIHDPQPSIGS